LVAHLRLPVPEAEDLSGFIRTVIGAVSLAFVSVPGGIAFGQANTPSPPFRANVDLVELRFLVSDQSGKYVTGLRASDIRIFEDDTPQAIASFSEGGRVQLSAEAGRVSGIRVYILLDTSNAMYDTLPRVCDAVADFIRHLNPEDSLAVYTFSRNLWRSAPLTKEHNNARDALRNVVAGEDTAVFNALLLTLRDAEKAPGRTVVVLFSNGSDNGSIVRPADVARVAADAGIPVYVISTQEAAKEEPTAKAFKFLTAYTGGKLYWGRNWQDRSKAFNAIHDDIEHSYSAGYYPAPNSNEGFRKIRIEVLPSSGKRYRVQVRPGYDARRASQ